EATDFADFHDYYMTNFIERGNFVRLGRTLSAPRAQFLNNALAEAYGKAADVSVLAISSQLIEIPDLGVVHGALTVNGKLASVLYFDDIAMGMFVVVEKQLDRRNEVHALHRNRPWFWQAELIPAESPERTTGGGAMLLDLPRHSLRCRPCSPRKTLRPEGRRCRLKAG